jgi:hypothetical protein
MANAAGRERTNQGETMALRAAALIAPQPTPLRTLTANSCQGSVTVAQPRIPAASDNAPALVTAAAPKRRCRAASFAPVTAPTRKCRLTALDTSTSGQPRVSRTTLRNTGGPKKPMPQPKAPSTKAAPTTRQP